MSNFEHVSLSLCLSLSSSQLISSDADGAIQRAGRFRVENGSSDEVRTISHTFVRKCILTSLLSQSGSQGFLVLIFGSVIILKACFYSS